VSLNNEKNCCEISEDKIPVCEKTAGLRCGKFSDLNFNENRFLGTFRGHSKRPILKICRVLMLSRELLYFKYLGFEIQLKPE
jgi:hypothetical protein